MPFYHDPHRPYHAHEAPQVITSISDIQNINISCFVGRCIEITIEKVGKEKKEIESGQGRGRGCAWAERESYMRV
jgi:hypothetical protein